MIVIAAIVLPQPDSPTIPTVSPASTSKLSPSTACTTPLRNGIRVLRSTISISGATRSTLLEAHVERVLQRVADEVERHHRDHDDDQRRLHRPPIPVLEAVRPVRQHRPPGGC